MCSITGCSTVIKSNESEILLTANNKELKKEDAVIIKICRPKSFMRNFESPDFFINGKIAAEVSNGAMIKVSANVGDRYSFVLASNIFAQRFKDVQIFDSKILEKKELYLILLTESKPDWAGGIDALFMSPVLAANRAQNRARENGLKNWWVNIVKKEDFEKECAVN